MTRLQTLRRIVARTAAGPTTTNRSAAGERGATGSSPKVPSSLVLAIIVLLVGCQPGSTASSPNVNPNPKTPSSSTSTNAADAGVVIRTDEEWRKILTPEQYRVLRQAGTERAFGAAYEEFKKQGGGTYVCAGCGAELFSSKEKFDSHCGWPSFYDPANAKNVRAKDDYSHGMVRTEVLCARCNGHLGHVFKGEGFPTPTDKRYCINAVSLKFIPAGQPLPTSAAASASTGATNATSPAKTAPGATPSVPRR